MTTTDMKGHEADTPAPGGLAAGADIYRRLERRRAGPQRLMAILFVAIAVALSGAVIAFEMMAAPDAPATEAQAGGPSAPHPQ
jgi:hypothetical protein